MTIPTWLAFPSRDAESVLVLLAVSGSRISRPQPSPEMYRYNNRVARDPSAATAIDWSYGRVEATSRGHGLATPRVVAVLAVLIGRLWVGWCADRVSRPTKIIQASQTVGAACVSGLRV